MRATLGMVLVFLGLVVGYLVLSGKFPSSSTAAPTSSSTYVPPTLSTTVTGGPVGGQTGGTTQQASIIANKNIGGGALGINMGPVNEDLQASGGGFTSFSNVHNFPTGEQLNDETSRRGNRR